MSLIDYYQEKYTWDECFYILYRRDLETRVYELFTIVILFNFSNRNNHWTICIQIWTVSLKNRIKNGSRTHFWVVDQKQILKNFRYIVIYLWNFKLGWEQGCKTGRKSNCVSFEIANSFSNSNCIANSQFFAIHFTILVERVIF